MSDVRLHYAVYVRGEFYHLTRLSLVEALGLEALMRRHGFQYRVPTPLDYLREVRARLFPSTGRMNRVIDAIREGR